MTHQSEIPPHNKYEWDINKLRKSGQAVLKLESSYQEKIREICSAEYPYPTGKTRLPQLTEDQFQAVFNLIEEERRKAVEEHRKHPF